jgi:antitoxin FitA
MGQLLVRNIDDDLIRRLKERAAAHGRSIVAEHRLILKQALERRELCRPRGAMAPPDRRP